jgi:hypothetical protein
MNKVIKGFSPALCALMLVSCGGKDVGSDSETIDMAVSVEPGTVAASLAGDDDALGLIDLKNIAFKYVIKGCKSGFKKDATANWVTEKDSIKLFKNDTGCIAELAGIKMNGSEFTKIYKKDNTSEVTVSINGAKAASGTVSSSTEISYFFYKPAAAAAGGVQFVLKVPDSGTFDTTKGGGLKWTFESIRSDLTTRKVSDVGFQQGMSVGALEAPNLTMDNGGTLTLQSPDSMTIGSTTYYGFKINAVFVCNDDLSTNLKKITGTGANATCRTPGGDQQKLSSMKAVFVGGRTADTTALSYDQAAEKFNAADRLTASGAAGVAVAGAADGTNVKFTDVRWWQNTALDTGVSYKGWLIIQMLDQDSSGNKFYSYTVNNVVVE